MNGAKLRYERATPTAPLSLEGLALTEGPLSTSHGTTVTIFSYTIQKRGYAFAHGLFRFYDSRLDTVVSADRLAVICLLSPENNSLQNTNITITEDFGLITLV